MNEFIEILEREFEKNANSLISKGQEAYMKNNFEFYGIKTPLRRKIQKPFLAKDYLPIKESLKEIVEILWMKPQREYQYFTQELVFKYAKNFEKQDIKLFEFMVENNSWWDTTDFIAPKLMGEYFKKYPQERMKYIEKWLASNNIWLQRCAVIFQLNYKEDLDTEILTYVINRLLGSTEFFINKAIGWVLRNYSRINANWVIEFSKKTELSKLSRKEALRLLDLT